MWCISWHLTLKKTRNPLKASQKLVMSHSNQWRKLHSETHTLQSDQSGSRISCLQRGTSGKESSCQCRRHKRRGFNPWVEKIPWRSKWQQAPVFLPGESQWTEDPGRLQSIQFHRIGTNWSNSESTTYLEMWLWASCFTFQSLHILGVPNVG